MKLDLTAARDRTLPDVLPAAGEPFHVLFCGINPGLYSAATGWHFARPGNRFWPALHLSGFTDRQLRPAEQDELTRYGLGITNIAPRATAQAAELTAAELRDGAVRAHGPGRSPSPALRRGAGRHGVPHRVRPSPRRRRPARRPAGPGTAVDPPQPQRPERALAPPRARERVRRTPRGGEGEPGLSNPPTWSMVHRPPKSGVDGPSTAFTRLRAMAVKVGYSSLLP